eukprot:jgi/Mesen1/1925/ME000146S01013
MTRVVQADIWAHQFPADCTAEGTKFLLADWLPMERHGLGSQLHIMTSLLSLAMAHGRILIPGPGSYQRARHGRCQGEGHESLACYFRRLTSSACEDEAMRLHSRTPSSGFLSHALTLIDSNLPVVYIHQLSDGSYGGVEIAR